MKFSIFKAVKILRGETGGWSSDRIYNAEFYIWEAVRKNPDEMKALSEDLSRDVNGWSEELGISPDRVYWFANRLKGIM